MQGIEDRDPLWLERLVDLRRDTPAQLESRSEDVLTTAPSPSKAPRWTPWRELLKRSFGVDGWACPYCDQRMRLRAVVLPPATHKILRGLQAACRAPPGADAMAG